MKARLITKGKGVFVFVKTDTMQDRRLFTQTGKLKTFLKFIRNNHTGAKIRFKEIRLN